MHAHAFRISVFMASTASRTWLMLSTMHVRNSPSMKPPFRADQVGSLLRPGELAVARRTLKGEALKEIEDRCIREAIARQEAIGLQAVTDGEMRRDWWHLDFLSQLDGVTAVANPGPKFGATGEQPPIPSVTGKLGCSKPIMVDDFAFLKKNTRQTAKFTIPSPAMLHLRGGRSSISKTAYPDLAEFWADAAAAYRKAIRQFADAGCTYLQLDDVSFSYLCDPKIRETCRRNGDDPAELPRTYADAVSAALAGRPAGMTVTMHTCRGNFKSSWVASGGYEPVAEAMFSSAVDGFFMEFDSERAGGFEPLRHLPKGKKVVLGLVTSKSPALEEKDFLKRRIEEAARYVPLEDLCLSPQCGFSSTHHGNALSIEQQWRKLERVVEVAREVWG
jgi:5-methyltetrahydropteroyltriglutamate--homocysteine methyltransferase